MIGPVEQVSEAPKELSEDTKRVLYILAHEGEKYGSSHFYLNDKAEQSVYYRMIPYAFGLCSFMITGLLLETPEEKMRRINGDFFHWPKDDNDDFQSLVYNGIRVVVIPTFTYDAYAFGRLFREKIIDQKYTFKLGDQSFSFIHNSDFFHDIMDPLPADTSSIIERLEKNDKKSSIYKLIKFGAKHSDFSDKYWTPSLAYYFEVGVAFGQKLKDDGRVFADGFFDVKDIFERKAQQAFLKGWTTHQNIKSQRLIEFSKNESAEPVETEDDLYLHNFSFM